jgi:hypothetical protein
MGGRGRGAVGRVTGAERGRRKWVPKNNMKLMSLQLSKGLQLLLMRYMQRLLPSCCQPHLLDVSISASPSVSLAVTILRKRVYFLNHIYT